LPNLTELRVAFVENFKFHLAFVFLSTFATPASYETFVTNGITPFVVVNRERGRKVFKTSYS
jgi:hypothetical protein